MILRNPLDFKLSFIGLCYPLNFKISLWCLIYFFPVTRSIFITYFTYSIYFLHFEIWPRSYYLNFKIWPLINNYVSSVPGPFRYNWAFHLSLFWLWFSFFLLLFFGCDKSHGFFLTVEKISSIFQFVIIWHDPYIRIWISLRKVKR